MDYLTSLLSYTGYIKMHLTRLGWGFIVTAFCTLFGATSSGNNLLYLVYSMLVAVLVVSYFINRINLSHLKVQILFPDQVFQDDTCTLTALVTNHKFFPALQVNLVISAKTGALSNQISFLPAHQTTETALRYIFPHRGNNKITDLYIETSFPFGLFWRRKKVDNITGLSYPKIFEVYGQRTSPAVSEEQISVPKRGVGDEFYGLREYVQGEDSRLINWKLTAKTGKPLVKEYAQQIGNKITVTVDGTPGPGTEERISEAVSLSKFFIDSGAEVRLVTNEGELDYGKGLIQLDLIMKTLALLGDGKRVKDTVSVKPKVPKNKVSLSDAANMKIFAYLTTAIAFASLFLIEELSPIFLSVIAIILPIGWFLDQKKFYPLPRILVDIVSVIFLLFIFLIDFTASGLLLTVTHLVLYIIGYILISPKTLPPSFKSSPSRLDGWKQLFLTDFLVFFLVSGQTINLWYFLFFILYFAAAGLWLVQWQDQESTSIKSLRIGSLSTVITTCFCFAAVSFAITPRVDNPRMQQFIANTGLNRLQTVARTFSGFTENIELGYFGTISKNPARVMRVSYVKLNEKTFKPTFIRIRGSAFNYFDGKRWQKTATTFTYKYSGRTLYTDNTRAWLTSTNNIIYLPNYDNQQPVFGQEIYIYPLNSSVVFTAEKISAIATDVPAAYFDFTDTIYFPSPYGMGIRYRTYSQSDKKLSLNDSIENYEQMLNDKFLNIPSPDDKYRQLVTEITGKYPDLLEKAQTLESYLKTKFSYSLTAQYGRQNLDEFLFKSRTGNCEYFATAMCVLLRYLNIPTRLTIGFLCDEWNEYGKFYDVRQSDAHAWVEAYIPGQGWVTFDPTPAETSLADKTNVLWSKIDKYFNAVQLRWYRYVIGYDNYVQRNTFYNFNLNLKRGMLINLILIFLVLMSIPLIYFLKPYRLLAKLLRRETPNNNNFYYLLLNQLKKGGFDRQPWQTGKEFAQDVVRAKPDLHTVDILTDYFYRVKYAGESLSSSDQQTIIRLLQQIKQEVDRK